jgi:hypothetical protein
MQVESGRLVFRILAVVVAVLEVSEAMERIQTAETAGLVFHQPLAVLL